MARTPGYRSQARRRKRFLGCRGRPEFLPIAPFSRKSGTDNGGSCWFREYPREERHMNKRLPLNKHLLLATAASLVVGAGAFAQSPNAASQDKPATNAPSAQGQTKSTTAPAP